MSKRIRFYYVMSEVSGARLSIYFLCFKIIFPSSHSDAFTLLLEPHHIHISSRTSLSAPSSMPYNVIAPTTSPTKQTL